MRVTKGEAFGTWIQRARNLLGFLRRVRRGYDFDQTTYDDLVKSQNSMAK
jgi:hypothetical protein